MNAALGPWESNRKREYKGRAMPPLAGDLSCRGKIITKWIRTGHHCTVSEGQHVRLKQDHCCRTRGLQATHLLLLCATPITGTAYSRRHIDQLPRARKSSIPGDLEKDRVINDQGNRIGWTAA
jgi:hypothetical protein